MGIPGFFEQVRDLQTRMANVVGEGFSGYRDCVRGLEADFVDAASWRGADAAKVQAHRDQALLVLTELTRGLLDLRSAAYHVGELGERDQLPMPELDFVVSLGMELVLQLSALATARGPGSGWPNPASAAMGAQHFGVAHREALVWIKGHLVNLGPPR